MTTSTVLTKPEEPGSKLEVWGHRATLLLEYAAALLIAAMAGVILANVFMRFFLGAPIQGTNEIVGNIMLPMVVFIGYVVSQARGESIEADIIYRKFPVQIRREVRFVTSIIAAVACFGFAWFGFREANHAMNIGKTAPASDIYIAPVYWFVPAAFAILVILFLLDAVRSLRGKFDELAEIDDDLEVG